jgi:uncharacterized protein DUF2637
VTATLTAAAFWLSYEHLHDVAAANGLDGARAWAWPGTVDAFIIAGELLILRAALRGRADWFAYLLAGVGSLGSIALNVAGVGTGADPLEYIVAAVPPVAALLAFAAVMRQVHERLAPAAEVTAEVTVERVADDQPRALPEAPTVVIPDTFRVAWKDPDGPTAEPLDLDHKTTNLVTSAVPAETPRQLVTEVVTLTPAELRRRASRLNRELVTLTNRQVTIDRLREEYGLTRREAAELRRLVVTSTGGDRS